MLVSCHLHCTMLLPTKRIQTHTLRGRMCNLILRSLRIVLWLLLQIIGYHLNILLSLGFPNNWWLLTYILLLSYQLLMRMSICALNLLKICLKSLLTCRISSLIVRWIRQQRPSIIIASCNITIIWNSVIDMLIPHLPLCWLLSILVCWFFQMRYTSCHDSSWWFHCCFRQMGWHLRLLIRLLLLLLTWRFYCWNHLVVRIAIRTASAERNWTVDAVRFSEWFLWNRGLRF